MTTAVLQARQSLVLTTSCLLAFVLLFLVIALSVSVGELSIPLDNVFYAISNKMGLTDVPLTRIYESVIWDFRLSRALVAACCGAGLAICGAVLQSLLKNAMAEPYVLGVSAGASTGAVSVVVLGIGTGAVSLSAGAFAGAFAAFAFVAFLTNGARGGNERTILAGVAASQLFNAITAYTISTSASAQQARDVMFWLLGSFSGAAPNDYDAGYSLETMVEFIRSRLDIPVIAGLDFGHEQRTVTLALGAHASLLHNDSGSRLTISGHPVIKA